MPETVESASEEGEPAYRDIPKASLTGWTYGKRGTGAGTAEPQYLIFTHVHRVSVRIAAYTHCVIMVPVYTKPSLSR